MKLLSPFSKFAQLLLSPFCDTYFLAENISKKVTIVTTFIAKWGKHWHII